MGIENSGEKRKDVTQVTKDEYENALQYAEVQGEANKENSEFDEKKNWATKSFVLEKLDSGDDWVLKHASSELRADKEVVLKAVKRGGAELQYASPELRDDMEVVKAAVGNVGDAIRYASQRLRSDKELVIRAVLNHSDVFLNVSSGLGTFRYDPDVEKAYHTSRNNGPLSLDEYKNWLEQEHSTLKL